LDKPVTVYRPTKFRRPIHRQYLTVILSLTFSFRMAGPGFVKPDFGIWQRDVPWFTLGHSSTVLLDRLKEVTGIPAPIIQVYCIS